MEVFCGAKNRNNYYRNAMSVENRAQSEGKKL
jgi:hypothetical protein